MKKIYLATVLLFSLMIIGTVLAQENRGAEPMVVSDIGVTEFTPLGLRNPGILPGSFWYFLDGWGEAIEEFFIFNTERKAILQTERMIERIAEINALLEKEGVDSPGLDIAEVKIQRNITRANEILERKQIEGREVFLLAEQLDDKFNIRIKLLNQIFEERRQSEMANIKSNRIKIRQALEVKNLDKIPELRSAIAGYRNARESLNNKRKEIQVKISLEKEHLEIKMSPSVLEIRRLEKAKEALTEEGERVVEELFKKREIAIENQEEVLEIQLNEAILAGDQVAIEQVYTNLLEIKLQEEAFAIEEVQFEKLIEDTQLKEKLAREKDKVKTEIEIILEVKDDPDGLEIMANKARVRAKEEVGKALIIAYEQGINQNPTIIGLIKQATLFHERALILFEKEEYKKSYLSSKKAMDFAGKAFKLISVKENLRRERPDLPISPGILPIEPVFPIPDTGEIIDERVSPERVKKEIKEAEQIIEMTRQLTEKVVDYKDVKGLTFPVVVKLIESAESNIDQTEALLGEGFFNLAYRQAQKAIATAKEAHKILVEKLEPVEIIIMPDPTERIAPITPPVIDNREDREMRCQTDKDCFGLICPMVIGRDTPRCTAHGREGGMGICYCGPSRDFKNQERGFRETIR